MNSLAAGGLCLLLPLLACGCMPPTRSAISAWIVSGDQDVYADSSPSFENDVYSASRGVLRLRAGIRDTAAIQVVLSSMRSDGPYRVELSDFSGPAGTLAAADTVRRYRVNYEPVDHFPSWYPEHTGRPALPQDVPDILVPWDAPRGGGPVNLENARNEIIWIDVYVPPTTEPGEYVSRLRAVRMTDSATAIDVRVELRVPAIVLPAQPALDVIARIDPNDLFIEHLRWPRQAAEDIRLTMETPSHRAAIRILDAALDLFKSHRLNPVLWASFPRFNLVGEREVAIDWTTYDALVERWIDGAAFSDLTPLKRWVYPASLAYPNSERNGGFDSPQYARLLAGYLAECRRHFEQRGWAERTLARICPPEPLSQAALDRVNRVGGIIRQSESNVPLLAHVPAESLRPLGWFNAPVAELNDVRIWAPPAMQCDTEAMQRQQGIGRDTWFIPDHPPYSGSLAVAAPATDATIVAWQAYQYNCSGIWVDDAGRCGLAGGERSRRRAYGLIYAGMQFGLIDEPVSSIRLKRLRRGVNDVALLRLLEGAGKERLARTVASRVVRWAFSDACEDHLLSTRAAGWPRDSGVLRLARDLMYQELSNDFEPSDFGASQQLANLAGWSQVMSQESKVVADVIGARIRSAPHGLSASVALSISNATDRAVSGAWRMATPPSGWTVSPPPAVVVPPNQRQFAEMSIALAGLPATASGAMPFELQFDSEALGAYAVSGRLAIATCPYITEPIMVDGDLGDWPRTPNNAAGDFRLARGVGTGRLGDGRGMPTLPTQAFFSMDRDNLYVGAFCGLREGEKPVWSPDNQVPIDGAMPWGQDVLEILLCPSNVASGTSADLFQMQIKPSGMVVARKGCATEPPMGSTGEWECDARVSVQIGRQGWVVEAAIPIASLGRPAIQNRIWGVNITRMDALRGEYSSWSGARGNCYLPQTLGNLILMRAY